MIMEDDTLGYHNVMSRRKLDKEIQQVLARAYIKAANAADICCPTELDINGCLSIPGYNERCRQCIIEWATRLAKQNIQRRNRK